MKYLRNHWKGLLSLLFAVIVGCFWAIGEVHLLSFQEQYQMFLFTPDYLWQRLSVPGGLADYIAEFITQFYYLFAIGAIALAILFLIFQWTTSRLCDMHHLPDSCYALTFVPATLLLAYMGAANVMLSLLIALIGTGLLMMWWKRIEACSTVSKLVFMLLVMPTAYWLIGPATLVLAAYIFLTSLFDHRHSTPLWLGIAAPVYAIVLILASTLILPQPLYRLFFGLNYYRYPGVTPWGQIAIMAIIAVWPFLGNILSKKTNLKPQPSILQLLLWLILVAGGVVLVRANYNTLANRLIKYDYLVRIHAWDKILKMGAEETSPTPMEVSCVNLALSCKGQLCDRLFEFYQNGGEGLFPTFTRNMLLPVSTAEAFYSIGMVNDCERFMFEAQQAIPNFKRSGRLTRRIIECEVINGQYAVARKLLNELRHTLFYRTWSERMLAALDSPQREKIINGDPIYGQLRKFRVTKDFLFSDREMDQMIGMLFVHNHSNHNAYEYLMAYELVQCDMERFMQYYSLGQYAGYSDHIPYAIQQGLLFDWTRKHNSYQGMPYSIDPQWVEAMSRFIKTYNTNPQDPALSSGLFAKTLWSYFYRQHEAVEKAKKEHGGSQEVY